MKAHGELKLDGRDTALLLQSEEDFPELSADHVAIQGMLGSGEVVSCLRCIARGQRSSYSASGRESHSMSFFPHYVVHGQVEMGYDDETISAVSFTTQDLEHICYDRRASGTSHGNAALMAGLLKDPDAKASDDALIAYFNGRRMLVDAGTALGHVQIVNDVSPSSNGTKGITLKNDFRVRVEFGELLPLRVVEGRVRAIKRFLSVVAGRRQCSSTFDIQHTSAAGEVLWSVVTDSMEATPPEGAATLLEWDLPIEPNKRDQEFAQVMVSWLAREPERLTARVSYAECTAKGFSYRVDRLVAAANMFDLLPAADVPATQAISDDLAAALKQAREVLLAVENSAPRNSVLGAIGRVGKPSLTTRVLHRAEIATAVFTNIFPDLDQVLILGVKFRNHCVHGSAMGVEPSLVYPYIAFLTDALEFVFLSSELIECGWDADRWKNSHGSMTHPMAMFRGSYQDSWRGLKKIKAI